MHMHNLNLARGSCRREFHDGRLELGLLVGSQVCPALSRHCSWQESCS
jgi:hypothetical protein